MAQTRAPRARAEWAAQAVVDESSAPAGGGEVLFVETRRNSSATGLRTHEFSIDFQDHIFFIEQNSQTSELLSS